MFYRTIRKIAKLRLDRSIKKERRKKYRQLRKLRQTRDIASEYTNNTLLLSRIVSYYQRYDLYEVYALHSRKRLAKEILEKELWMIKPVDKIPRPPIPRSLYPESPSPKN